MEYHIGKRVSEVMKHTGVTNKQLANHLKVTKQGLYAILKRSSLDCSRLYQLSVALRHNFFEEIAATIPEQTHFRLTPFKSNTAPAMASFSLREGCSIQDGIHYLHEHFNPDFNVQRQPAPLVLGDIYLLPRLLDRFGPDAGREYGDDSPSG